MANPFEVRVPNALEALMAGESGYRGMRDIMSQREQSAARKAAQDAILSGGDTKSALARLIGAGDMQGAQVVGTLGKADTTDEIKEYNLSKSQGFKGAFTDWKTGLKKAGATNVNVNSGEKAYDQAIGKEMAELNIGIIKGAGTAQNNINTLQRLDQLLQDPSVYQGSGGERILQAKRLAKSIGIDVGDVGPAEAAQAITAQLALNARSPAGGAGMPGAMSDADRDYLKSMQPGIERTPGGNKLIIDVNRKINQRAVDVEKFRQDYVQRRGRLDEGFYRDLSDWSAKNPMFSAAAPSAPQGGPSIDDLVKKYNR